MGQWICLKDTVSVDDKGKNLEVNYLFSCAGVLCSSWDIKTNYTPNIWQILRPIDTDQEDKSIPKYIKF